MRTSDMLPIPFNVVQEKNTWLGFRSRDSHNDVDGDDDDVRSDLTMPCIGQSGGSLQEPVTNRGFSGTFWIETKYSNEDLWIELEWSLTWDSVVVHQIKEDGTMAQYVIKNASCFIFCADDFLFVLSTYTNNKNCSLLFVSVFPLEPCLNWMFWLENKLDNKQVLFPDVTMSFNFNLY